MVERPAENRGVGGSSPPWATLNLEFSLIADIKKLLNSQLIGDDAVFLENGIVLSCDSVVEEVHFLKGAPKRAIGFKLISASISDIVCKGGKPKYCLIALHFPRGYPLKEILEIYEGIKEACEHYSVEVVGGNTTRSGLLSLDCFVFGKAKRFVRRSGAKVGDYLYLSASVGNSLAGLYLLKEGKRIYKSFEKKLISWHLKPKVDLRLSRVVSKFATSSIDVSDSLVSELWHLAKESGVRLDVYSKAIPLSPELLKFCKVYGKNPIDFALKSGEEYRVLFTSPYELPYPKIGRVREGEGVFLDGKPLEEDYGYFKHF